VLLIAQSEPFVSHPSQLGNKAFADWIGPDSEIGVFYFRKHLHLDAKPDSFFVHVSADNRYRLFVNGEMVLWGPAVGDLSNWNYESMDIASYLKKGKNILAAQVWNFGSNAGARQISHKTAFILQGETEKERIANTNNSWLVKKDDGYFSIRISRAIAGGGYIAGATDSIDGRNHPWGWEQMCYNDTDWRPAKELGQGNHNGLDTWLGTPWLLKPREIPAMEQKQEHIPDLHLVNGYPYNVANYNGNLNLEIPPNKHIEILLDNRVLTMGFPQLSVSKGRNSNIKIQYQEALFDANGNKGNRDEWHGKEMKGYYDAFVSDGGDRMFEPLWIRVFRYVKITIDTKEEPLKINSFTNLFTAYPFEQKGSFYSNNDSLQKIWDASWRTAKLCTLETYMDCPYYEQLQYIGDTRIQALISMYVAGDDRLARNAIQQLYGSMQSMGLTKSNHPSAAVQIIPPFSLHLIGMIHDYYMLRDDEAFIKQYLPGVKFILDWFVSKIDDNGILGPLPYWNHIDGGTGFINGSPPGVSDGGSAHISILLAQTLDLTAEMMEHFDEACEVQKYRQISASLKKNTMKLCFDEEKQLIAETPVKQIFSQHTNSLAILSNMFSPMQEQIVAQKIIADTSLIQATLYFDFYVFQALKKAGLGVEVINLMDKWQVFLDNGFTTFPEHGIESRSDCHAWSAHPIYDFLNITCGVKPTSPGFKSVEIAPQLGQLNIVQGKIVHPQGEIAVSFVKDEKGFYNSTIHLPEKITGELLFKQKKYKLAGGENNFQLK
jgi:hypothetical protein